MVIFWPWWEGGGLAPRWGVLALVSTLLLCFCVSRIRLTPVHYAGAGLILWSTLSLLWTPILNAGLAEIAHLLIFAAVFCVAAEAENLRATYIAIIAGVAISGAVAIAQSLGLDWIPSVNSPAGLFVNRNYMAETAALALILTIATRQWWALALILCAAFLPHSRNVIFALAGVGLCWLVFRSTLAALLLVAAVVVLMIVPLPFYLVDGSSLTQRIGVWKATVEHLTVLGHGAGSFFVVYPDFMPHSLLLHDRPAHAHNELLNTASDLGLPGVLFFLGFFGISLRYAGEVERLVLVGSLALGLFSFPLHLPASGFVVALVAGSAARRWYLVRGSEQHGGTASRRRLADAWDRYYAPARPHDSGGGRLSARG